MKRFITYTVLIMMVIGLHAETNKLDIALKQSEIDIKTAIKELGELKERIQEEKTPLVTRLKQEKHDVSKLRKEAETARLASGTGINQLQNLREDVERLQREIQFIDSELKEYHRSILTIAPPLEQASMMPILDKINESKADRLTANTGEEAKILFDISYNWCSYAIGGYLKKGQCLDVDGYEQSGTFAVLGNLGWFVSDHGDAGLVVQRLNSVKPSYVSDFSETEKQQIVSLCTEGKGDVPMDLNKGDALKIHNLKKTIADDLKAGGYTIYPLIAIGLIALITALFKWINLLILKPYNERVADKLAEAIKNTKDTKSILQSIQKPFRGIFQEAVDNADMPKEHLEELLYEQVVMASPNIRKYISMLAVLGAVAPLLGLLGTVTGMIHTFEVITIFGTGNPAILSGGISEALITTKIGLAIAIPTLLVHAYLSAKAKTVVSELEDQTIYFVNQLKK